MGLIDTVCFYGDKIMMSMSSASTQAFLARRRRERNARAEAAAHHRHCEIAAARAEAAKIAAARKAQEELAQQQREAEEKRQAEQQRQKNSFECFKTAVLTDEPQSIDRALQEGTKLYLHHILELVAFAKSVTMKQHLLDRMLYLAIYQNNHDAVKSALENGADANSKLFNPPPLCYAIQNMPLAADKLLEHKADINIVDPANGWTVWHYIFEYKKEKCRNPVYTKTWLLDEKSIQVDMNVPNAKKETPFHFAVMHGSSYINKVIEYKPDLAAKDSRGWTPLHFAASVGKLDSLLWLFKHNVDRYAVDNEGHTALQIILKTWAWNREQSILPAIAAFIEFDKEINLPTLLIQANSNNVLLDYLLVAAYENGFEYAFNCLLDAGADIDKVEYNRNPSQDADPKPDWFLTKAKLKKKLKEYSAQEITLANNWCCFWLCGAEKSRLNKANAANALLNYIESGKQEDLQQVMPLIQQDEQLHSLHEQVQKNVETLKTITKREQRYR